ncbi:formate dehydrogenase H, selenopolypeptide subunit [Klebsiella grimontii]|uniref:Formate dehydrogenase H, selenopolypeptide subunit n=1 Tax=Klebsiella grimontii TaxID=2058152 RepID=A0A7H4P2B8_9ENTR|nr:formate dehydrogenase H, selenopolypeptide subunit [Klebsiella grimontii]
MDQNRRNRRCAAARHLMGGTRAGVFTCADRGFQRFEQAIIATGNVKRDWEIISLLASEMGYPMHYDNNQQIWDEMRELCPLFYGVTYEKMGDMNHVQWPCPTLDHPVLRGCIKITSSIRRPVKVSCSPPRGVRLPRRRMKRIRWCCVPCAKSATTRVVR